MVAHDFDLQPRRETLTLVVPGRMRRQVASLFPDVGLTTRRHEADAVLTARGINRPRHLVLRPSLLRGPPIAGHQASMHGATLSSQDRSWSQRILTQEDWFTPSIADRADAIRRIMLDHRLGGTWWGCLPTLRVAGRAIVFAACNARLTAQMLAHAIERHGADQTVVVSMRNTRVSALCRGLGVTVIEGVVDPWPLAEEAACLHVDGESEAGLIGRLVGTEVHVHSNGALAETANAGRLIAATVLLGARYVDPVRERPIACEAFLEHAMNWRRQTANQGEIGCFVGISFWKRRRIREMFSPSRRPAFRRTARAAVATAGRRQGAIVAWASRMPPGLERAALEGGIPLNRVEDGFIRSIGLGADFLPPLSVVFDRSGLYYDPTKPSDLEELLAGSWFGPVLLSRAAALRARMVAAGVTKYNLTGRLPALPAVPGQRIVLVPGQVADDRSVLLGGAGCSPGLALLQAVRRAVPDAFIVYKPHPDVEAGYRAGAVADADALLHVDAVLRGGSMAALLDKVDEVHTLTSLTGFEALLRGKPVTTYGQPFYAGWGLTTDHNPVPRRTRQLSIDELVAGTLILYPCYIDPISRVACGPETVLDRLGDPALVTKLQNVGWLVRVRRLQGSLLARFKLPISAQTEPGLSTRPVR